MLLTLPARAPTTASETAPAIPRRSNVRRTLTGGTWPFAATNREGLWRCGLVQRAVVVLLLGCILLLAPFAFASAADASYIAGLYDEGDFDDVNTLIHNISALTGDNGASDAPSCWKVTPTLLVLGISARLRNGRLPLALIRITCCRAPPSGHRDGCPRAVLPVTVSVPFLPPPCSASPLLPGVRAGYRATSTYRDVRSYVAARGPATRPPPRGWWIHPASRPVASPIVVAVPDGSSTQSGATQEALLPAPTLNPNLNLNLASLIV